MEHLNILLPIALVAIAFLLKLFMDRSATAPLVVRSLYELPVDILFLSISFSAAAAISSTEHVEKGLLYSIIFLVVALLSVVGWRRSIVLFEINHRVWSAVLFVVNATVSGFCLALAISLLVEIK